MFKKLLLLLSSVTFACVLGEGLTRMQGHRPYQVDDNEITFHPSPYAVPDPQLGYVLRPGKFIVQFKNGFSWTATHNADSYRIASARTADNALPQLFVYGCSVAYGYGVADSESFPFLLQQELPGFTVKNYAVPGFAQTQAYLQLKQGISENHIPKVVVLTYASFHDIRNTLCRQRRKEVYPYNHKSKIDLVSYPVASYTGPDSFGIDYQTFNYREWPLMRYSALINFLENRFDELEVGWKKSHEVSEILIKKINSLCLDHNIHLIVAGIQRDPLTEETLSFCNQEGIDNVDISFDPDDSSYTLRPFDPHPNSKGQAYYADKLHAYLAKNN